MYNDYLSYLQARGIVEQWVMEWYLYRRDEMYLKDPSLFQYAHYIYKKYF